MIRHRKDRDVHLDLCKTRSWLSRGLLKNLRLWVIVCLSLLTPACSWPKVNWSTNCRNRRVPNVERCTKVEVPSESKLWPLSVFCRCGVGEKTGEIFETLEAVTGNVCFYLSRWYKELCDWGRLGRKDCSFKFSRRAILWIFRGMSVSYIRWWFWLIFPINLFRWRGKERKKGRPKEGRSVELRWRFWKKCGAVVTDDVWAGLLMWCFRNPKSVVLR